MRCSHVPLMFPHTVVKLKAYDLAEGQAGEMCRRHKFDSWEMDEWTNGLIPERSMRRTDHAEHRAAEHQSARGF